MGIVYEVPPGAEPVKRNLVQAFWDRFNQFDRFTKFTLLTMALIAIATPSIIGGYLTFYNYADESQTASITADFAERSDTQYAIPADIFGSNDYIPANFYSQFPSLMQEGGFRTFRRVINLASIFPDAASLTDPTKRSWISLKALSAIQAGNIQPIFSFVDTPAWLQPSTNPCTEKGYPSRFAFPTSLTTWGELAQIAMQYIDKAYPNLHPYYEIWNEPDSDGEFCLPGHPSATDPTRVHTYLSMYEVVAPLLRRQASRDHVSIKIGGPVIGENQDSEAIINAFMPAFLNDTKISPYIDFVSYHNYFLGTDWPSTLNATQDSQNGFAAKFVKVSSYVRNGEQHNAATTPIYIDEYNTGTHTSAGCCRNTYQYAPLWNSLIISDIFTSVATQNGSSPTPLAIPYFNYFEEADAADQFCLFGIIDKAMDCANNGTMQPYPQYYTYKLLANPSYLDILNHAYLTRSQSANHTLNTFSFFTATKDNLVIVNTGSTSYGHLLVLLRNPGTIINGNAAIFTLDEQNASIRTSHAALTGTSLGYATFVDVLPYSTVAISAEASSAQPSLVPTICLPQSCPAPAVGCYYKNVGDNCSCGQIVCVARPTPTPTPTITPAACSNQFSFFTIQTGCEGNNNEVSYAKFAWNTICQATNYTLSYNYTTNPLSKSETLAMTSTSFLSPVHPYSATGINEGFGRPHANLTTSLQAGNSTISTNFTTAACPQDAGENHVYGIVPATPTPAPTPACSQPVCNPMYGCYYDGTGGVCSCGNLICPVAPTPLTTSTNETPEIVTPQNTSDTSVVSQPSNIATPITQEPQIPQQNQAPDTLKSLPTVGFSGFTTATTQSPTKQAHPKSIFDTILSAIVQVNDAVTSTANHIVLHLLGK